MTEMAAGESAGLLAELARPVVEDCPDVQLQKSMIKALEAEIGKDYTFDKEVLFVGAVELPVIPDASDEEALFDTKLVNLPSRFETGLLPGTTTHSLQVTRNGFPVVEATGIGRSLVRLTLLTMRKARQLEYLRKSGFVGKGWKVVVEVHYYRSRPAVGDFLHKDTLGQTLFVNLNYDTDVDILGPEYVLNPDVVPKHEEQIRDSLPEQFLADLQWVRGRLGRPTEVSIASVKPNQFVAFVDEAIHHKSPHAGGRTLTAKQLLAFIEKEYGAGVVDDIRAAGKAFREANQGPTAVWYLVSGTTVADFVKVAPVKHAKLLLQLVDLADLGGAVIDRSGLKDAGMTPDAIDRLLDSYWPNFREVGIPGAGSVELTNAPLKRQASDDALNKRLPPPVQGDRRFFRTWVRIVRA